MMKRLFLPALILAIIFLTIPTAFALSATITMKSEPFHTGILWIFDDNGNKLKTYYILAPEEFNVDGEAQVEYSTSRDTLTFQVIIKHPITKEVVDDQTFDDIKVEEEIYLDLIEAGGTSEEETEDASNETEEEMNETENMLNETESMLNETEEEVIEEVTETEEVASSGNRVTGFFISEDTGRLTGTVYYLIGAIILVIIIFLFVLKGGQRFGYSIPPHLTKGKMKFSEELKDAEKKLEDAKREIREIKKGRSKITEAEEEFNRAKEKLERLRKEEDEDEKKN